MGLPPKRPRRNLGGSASFKDIDESSRRLEWHQKRFRAGAVLRGVRRAEVSRIDTIR
jgi:hypothetical protein